MLMSPLSTFQSCGNSSSRVRRMNPPTGVIRGSPACAHTGARAGLRILRIDRNLCTVNTRPSWPDARLVVEHRTRRRAV